jgi:hypothetical protein
LECVGGEAVETALPNDSHFEQQQRAARSPRTLLLISWMWRMAGMPHSRDRRHDRRCFAKAQVKLVNPEKSLIGIVRTDDPRSLMILSLCASGERVRTDWASMCGKGRSVQEGSGGHRAKGWRTSRPKLEPPNIRGFAQPSEH